MGAPSTKEGTPRIQLLPHLVQDPMGMVSYYSLTHKRQPYMIQHLPWEDRFLYNQCEKPGQN